MTESAFAGRMRHEKFFSCAADKRRDDLNYRASISVERIPGRFPYATWHSPEGPRDVVVWCSNDQLGMSQHPKVVGATLQTVLHAGAGAGGARDTCGTNRMLLDLEAEIADLHRKQAAMLFTSGYIANAAGLSAVARLVPRCLVISDEHNHHSMIEGISKSGCKKRIWRHNDLEHLEQILREERGRPALIAFESIYAISGDVAPIRQICDLARRFGAITYLNEANAVGICGAGGAGMAEREGLASRIDIIEGTLAQAYGCLGGYIAGRAVLVDALRTHAPGYAFTNALPPPLCAASLAAIRHLKESSWECERLAQNAATLRAGLIKAGLPVRPGQEHIISLAVGDIAMARAMCNALLSDFSLHLRPAGHSAAARDTAYLRILPSSHHDKTMLTALVNALAEVWRRFEPSWSYQPDAAE